MFRARLHHFAFTVLIVLSLGFTALATAQSTPENATKHWAQVLEKYVNDRGQINFCRLDKDEIDLRAYVDYVGRVSPESAPSQFPTRNAKLAYYINSYNALSMINVINYRIPKELGFFTRLRFFAVTHFMIGKKSMSLYTYENSVIRAMGDERVHFALNCMSVGCPRLPDLPFSGEHIGEQLDQAARQFFSDPKNLRIDVANQTVWVSSILDFYEDDFLKKSPTLANYIDRYAPQKIPINMPIKFIPYDWTVNTQSGNC